MQREKSENQRKREGWLWRVVPREGEAGDDKNGQDDRGEEGEARGEESDVRRSTGREKEMAEARGESVFFW